MIIFGAGMAGLLTAQMLRRHSPIVYEAQERLPDNHGALLRFRTDSVSRVTGIPFKRVQVQKAVLDQELALRSTATIADSNAYSLKVTGEVSPRSILNMEPSVRYIAPDDFLACMARGLNIRFGAPLNEETIHDWERLTEDQGFRLGPMISTIPMPVLMQQVGWPERPDFSFTRVWSVRAVITSRKIDVYQTIYAPWEERPWYRASLTGPLLTLEYVQGPTYYRDDVNTALTDFGIDPDRVQVEHQPPKLQEYGKLLPLSEASERARRTFILGMTDKYNLYSVGRFATWRQILLDDIVHDVEMVERFITERDAYRRQLIGR